MLEQIAYVSQILAAVGVILSLIYVGRQLRLTNAMSRSAVRQSMSGQMTEFTMSIAASPALSESVAKMLLDGPTIVDVSATERIQMASCYGSIVEQIHLAYIHKKDGIFSQQEMETIFPPSNPWMSTPYLRSFWPRLRDNWGPEFAEWFERRYQVDPEPPRS